MGAAGSHDASAPGDCRPVLFGGSLASAATEVVFVVGGASGEAGKSVDAHLTAGGWEAAHAAAEALRRRAQGEEVPVQLVVAPPAMKHLETAAALAARLPPPNTSTPDAHALKGGAPGHGQGVVPIMVETTECLDPVRPGHAALAAPQGGPPVAANELCRERVGGAPWERRNVVFVLRALFPGVSFEAVPDIDDPIHREGQTEDGEALARRAAAFLRWAALRPERCIVAVTGPQFVQQCFRQHAGQDASALGALPQPGEVCSVLLVNAAAGSPASAPPANGPAS